MMFVSDHFNVLGGERVDVIDARVEPKDWQGQGFAGDLKTRLLQVVEVEVGVAKAVDKHARFQPADLGDHVSKEAIGRDVERYSKEHVGAALVHLAVQPPFSDVELEKGVAGHEGHISQIRNVPRTYDDAAAVRLFSDEANGFGHLVVLDAVRSGPTAPLFPIHWAEVPVLIGPLVPDANAVVPEVANVGVSLQEPQQLVNNRRDVNALCGHERKAFAEVETHLMAEDAQGARARPVFLLDAFIKHTPDQVEVGVHALHFVPRPLRLVGLTGHQGGEGFPSVGP